MRVSRREKGVHWELCFGLKWRFIKRKGRAEWDMDMTH